MFRACSLLSCTVGFVILRKLCSILNSIHPIRLDVRHFYKLKWVYWSGLEYILPPKWTLFLNAFLPKSAYLAGHPGTHLNKTLVNQYQPKRSFWIIILLHLCMTVCSFVFSDLQLNRIICDCNLKWMVKWMANLGRRLSILGRCEYPLAFKGTKIAHLTRKETVCGMNEHKEIIIYAIAVCCQGCCLIHQILIWQITQKPLESCMKTRLVRPKIGKECLKSQYCLCYQCYFIFSKHVNSKVIDCK